MAAVTAAAEKNATVCWEWFAEPFAMGRILREVFEYDRRDDLDILQLLERQGFQVVEAVGGVGVVAGEPIRYPSSWCRDRARALDQSGADAASVQCKEADYSGLGLGRHRNLLSIQLEARGSILGGRVAR